jgi:hypothetical protein
MRTGFLMIASTLLLPAAAVAQQSHPAGHGTAGTHTTAGQPSQSQTSRPSNRPATPNDQSQSGGTNNTGTVATGQTGSGATASTTPDTIPPTGDTVGQPGSTLGTGSTATTSEAPKPGTPR